MPLSLPERPDRSAPRPEDSRKSPERMARLVDPATPRESFDGERHAREVREHLRKTEERRCRDNKEIKDAMPGDRRDEVDVVSKGVGVEVAVPHGMPSPPDRFDQCFADGDGRVYASRGRGNLADDENVYFKTSGVAGVTFCVRLYTKQDKSDRTGRPSNAERFLGSE